MSMADSCRLAAAFESAVNAPSVNGISTSVKIWGPERTAKSTRSEGFPSRLVLISEVF